MVCRAVSACSEAADRHGPYWFGWYCSHTSRPAISTASNVSCHRYAPVVGGSGRQSPGRVAPVRTPSPLLPSLSLVLAVRHGAHVAGVPVAGMSESDPAIGVSLAPRRATGGSRERQPDDGSEAGWERLAQTALVSPN